MNTAEYEIVEDPVDPRTLQVSGPLVIRDLNAGRSVTNDAERVVRELWEQGRLFNERRLFYYDSEGSLDELVHDEGTFVRFAPGPGRVDPDEQQRRQAFAVRRYEENKLRDGRDV